jgi:hypothetical protein
MPSGCIFVGMKSEDIKALEAMIGEDLILRRDSDLARMAELKSKLANELPKRGPKVGGVGFSKNREGYNNLAREVAFINELLSAK